MIDDGAVREFVDRYLPARSGAVLRPLGVGDFSTWLVGEDLIIRFAFNTEGDRQLATEVAALPVIARHVNLGVPQVVVVGQSALGHRGVGYPFLPGPSAEEVTLGEGTLQAAARAMGEFLARLHTVEIDQIAQDLPTRTVDYAARLARVTNRAAVVFDKAGALVNPLMRSYLEGRVSLPSGEPRHVVCHTDLKGEHVLLDAQTSAVTAVIDWGDVALDDPAVDIGSLAIWLGEPFVTEVARHYGAHDDLIERGLFRIRTWILAGFADMLAGRNQWPRELVHRQVVRAFGD